MNPREIVDAYLQGRIESWGVYRRLVRLGVTTATALAVATTIPLALQARNLDALTEIAQNDDKNGALLNELIAHLAAEIQKVEGGGPVRPLAAALARIGAQNWNLANCPECEPIKVNVNDGVNNLGGSLVVTGRQNNITLSLVGTIGQSNVNLTGAFDPPAPIRGFLSETNPPNDVRRVNLNFVGHVGQVPLNIFGNLGLFLYNNSFHNK